MLAPEAHTSRKGGGQGQQLAGKRREWKTVRLPDSDCGDLEVTAPSAQRLRGRFCQGFTWTFGAGGLSLGGSTGATSAT